MQRPGHPQGEDSVLSSKTPRYDAEVAPDAEVAAADAEVAPDAAEVALGAEVAAGTAAEVAVVGIWVGLLFLPAVQIWKIRNRGWGVSDMVLMTAY